MTVLLALAGCTWISAEQLTQGLDRDGDGVDDRQDCDPTDGGTGTLESRFDDLDGDGFGAGEPRTTCGAPPGTAERGGDCDDGSPDVHPNAAEVCNGVDDDCDGLIDDLDPGITGRPELYRDDDGDGVPGDVLEPACVAGHGLLPRAAQVDCDDADPARSPGRDEVCGNGVDDDCDDLVDIAGVDPFSRWFDADGDGVPAAGASDRCIADEPGWLQEPPDGLFDCNDSRADQFPGALEVPGDGIDQDCSGLDLVRCPVDADQDGFAPVLDPLDPNTFTLAEQGTCTSYPAAVDCDDADAALVPTTTYWLDADADGVPGAVQTVSCAPPDSRPWLTVGPAEPDCADDDAGRAPGMPEVPDDGIDQDCSGADTVTCPEDADHDGHGVPGTILEPTGVCALAPCDPGVPGDCDCDDTRADVHPGAVELCDEVDRDCDGAPFAGPLETLWTDGVPGQADVVLTLGRTDVLRVCGDADFDHTLTLSGGRVEGIGGVRPRLVGDGVLPAVRIGQSGSLRNVAVRASGAGGVQITGAAVLDGVEISEADMAVRITGGIGDDEVVLADVTLAGNARPLDAAGLQDLDVAGLVVGPHTSGIRLVVPGLQLVGAQLDFDGAVADPVLDIQAESATLTGLEVLGGPGVGLRIAGEADLTDIHVAGQGGAGLVLLDGLHTLQDVTVESAGGVQAGSSVLFAEGLVVRGGQRGLDTSLGVYVLWSSTFEQVSGRAVRVGAGGAVFFDGGSISQNGAGLQVEGRVSLQGTTIAGNPQGGLVLAGSEASADLDGVVLEANGSSGFPGFVAADGLARLHDVTVTGHTHTALKADGHGVITFDTNAPSTFTDNAVDLAIAGMFDRDCSYDSAMSYEICYAYASVVGPAGSVSFDTLDVVTPDSTCALGAAGSASCWCSSDYDSGSLQSYQWCECSTSGASCGYPVCYGNPYTCECDASYCSACDLDPTSCDCDPANCDPCTYDPYSCACDSTYCDPCDTDPYTCACDSAYCSPCDIDPYSCDCDPSYCP